jgi:antitoxin FitA
MAQILVRNLDGRLKTRLQRRAKRHGRSMEEEAREILRCALTAEDAQKVGFGTASVALFSGSGVYLDELIAEIATCVFRFRTLSHDSARHQPDLGVHAIMIAALQRSR